jgi:hypothetical protein
MALNFPSSPVDNQKFTFADKNYRYNATLGIWRMERISGSYLDDLEDVDVTDPQDGAYLVLTQSRWIPKIFTGSFTGSYKTSFAYSNSISESILSFQDNGGGTSEIVLPQNVFSLVDTGSSYALYTGDSEQILFASASYADTASSANVATEVETYPFDNYAQGVNFASRQLYMTMSYGVAGVWEVGQYSASINKYTNTKTVIGRTPDINGNVNVALNTVITGTLAERPASSVDGDLYVLQNETGSRLGTNGTAFIYSDGSPELWYEVTPPTEEAADARYAERSGSVMLGNLKAFDLALTGSEPATLAYTNAKVPTKDTNLRAFRTVTSFDYNPPYNTWSDLQFDTTDTNDTGGTITAGVFEVPASGVTRMTFSAGGSIRHGMTGNQTTTHIRIVLNGTRILAEQSHALSYNGFRGGPRWRDEGINVSTGIVQVAPGDEIKVQVKRGWNNRNKTFSRGTNDLNTGNIAERSGGTYFCGVINDTPPGSGITGMLGGDGIDVTGDVENKVVATDATVLRRDIQNSISAGQTFGGEITGTGSLVVNGNASIQNLVFSGSAFLTGDIQIDGLGNYASDAEASANGVAVGKLYKNGNQVMIRTA